MLMVSGYILLLGLVLGSFLGALTYRLPRGVSIASGRSYCPRCKKKIAWFDNIPVLSFLILGGRCRSCRKKISVRYPLIEATTALVFMGVYFLLQGQALQQGLALMRAVLGFWALPYLLMITVIMIIIFITDLEHRIIFDEVIFSGFLVVFLVRLLSSDGIYTNLAAAFTGATFLLLIHLATFGRGMGLGDVKFALFPGLFFGLPQTIVWLFLAFAIGALFGLILILAEKATLKNTIAFGPFLVISFFLTLFWGNQITNFFGF